MFRLFFIFVCAGLCIVPPILGQNVNTISPKAKESSVTAMAIVLPPPRIITNVSLSWTYSIPMPSPNIVFEVWRQTNAVMGAAHWIAFGTNLIPQFDLVGDPIQLSTNWHLFATVNQSPFRFPNNLNHALFIMRAKDLNTGLVSDWARK